LEFAESLIFGFSRLLPLKSGTAFFFSALLLGPILGSFITEPAAMTVTAFLLLEHFYRKNISTRLKYAALGTLFVNISIGGTLTPFAAPPILMVAGKWGWGLSEMLTLFGWKGVLACTLSSGLVSFLFRRELKKIEPAKKPIAKRTPFSLKLFHLGFLAVTVMAAHHPVLVLGILLFFLGLTQVTASHQDPLKLKEGLLVAFFLSGLVVLGGLQNFWLEPILLKLDALPLYLSAIGLTAFTDNAALTYLGSLVPTLKEASRYALVAGAVVGGGLTVIANAPNPAGYTILSGSFGREGISPWSLFKAALLPTLIAGLCFWFL
jgi:Na+/H+ antiporter NhaD/arsenite permease-like protein